MSRMIKGVLFLLLCLACCIDDVRAGQPNGVYRETKQQCEQRNRENNKKQEDAGITVSAETKRRQQELCNEKE